MNKNSDRFVRRPKQFSQSVSYASGVGNKKVFGPEIVIEPDFLVTNNDEIIITNNNKKIITN